MRTPGHEDELAVGFLRHRGPDRGPQDPPDRARRPGRHEPARRPDHGPSRARFDAGAVAERHFVATASCGICGKASLDEVAVRSAPIPDGSDRDPDGHSRPARPAPGRPARIRRDGRAPRRRAVHGGGELIALREDVGRHNALDKVIGSQVLAKATPLNGRILMVSGRVSFEIVQKAAVAGIPSSPRCRRRRTSRSTPRSASA